MRQLLIVDDEAFAREAVANTIPWSDYEIAVSSVSSGAEALEFMEKTAVHLLMTDIRMEEMSGLELIEAVHERGWTPGILVLSSYNEFELVRSAMQLGASDYLFKPTMMPEEILEAVLRVLAKQKAGKDEKTSVEDSARGSMKREIYQALDFIGENLENKNLSLGMVADYVGVSKNYFSKIFKESMNEKFVDYVTRLRMEQARNLYLNSDLKIYEIAERVGYSDWHYLYNVYKKLYGHSLSKEREQV